MTFRSSFSISPLHLTADYASKLVTDIAEKSAKARENVILAQLNDFISRGLIEIETSDFVLVQKENEPELEIRQTVSLKLKDKEYVQRLEEVEKKYNDLVKMIKDGIL